MCDVAHLLERGSRRRGRMGRKQKEARRRNKGTTGSMPWVWSVADCQCQTFTTHATPGGLKCCSSRFADGPRFASHENFGRGPTTIGSDRRFCRLVVLTSVAAGWWSLCVNFNLPVLPTSSAYSACIPVCVPSSGRDNCIMPTARNAGVVVIHRVMGHRHPGIVGPSPRRSPLGVECIIHARVTRFF